MRYLFLGTLALAWTLSGCAGPREFTRGQYGDPSEIAMLDDKWNQNDMQLVAKKMIGSMEVWLDKQEMADKPIIILETPKNRTSEHIDMSSLYDHVKTALIQSGRFSFLDKAARGEIAGEYEYQGSGYVDPNQAKGPGQQKAAEYLMGGVVTSTVQQVGSNKLVYYKATFELTDILTTEIIWTDQKEIRKDFKKKSVGL
ncbi:MAG: penicillin-binding protein activator LpoB [Candidatus Latescibacteria bacterium]|nr:penicillin-binding protein activator LpoB [Candidatus Latescibacterota bacterium]